MTEAEAFAILDAALDRIGEHFDAVQIHASWMENGNSTQAAHRGSGNWYARESMCREFIERNKADEQAQFIAQKLNPDET